jgi:DNA-binding transcriptional ArsR family regulator
VRTTDLLLHPVRMRVVQCLLGDRELTTAQLREELSDVPPATLYRHVATLLEGGALEVVDERRVRGTFERTYRLRPENAVVSGAEAATMSAEEHAQAFAAFMTGRLSDFERYLGRGDVDLERDRVGYRMIGLHLTDEETDELIADLGEVLRARLGNRPTPGRRRRVLSTILVPAHEVGEEGSAD